MNYYPHHIGDFARDTAHLTMLEEGAYRRMLDLYYTSERPLPLDRKGLYRLVRARSTLERCAVDTVLAEYFQEGPTGWNQRRCDAEIAKALEEGEDNAARKDNERERQRRHRQRRKELFAQLRSHGVVPKWDTALEELETLLSRQQKRSCHGDSNAPETAIHNPIANSQEPRASSKHHPSDDLSGTAPDATSLNGKARHVPDAESVLSYLNQTAGRAFEFRSPAGKLTANADTIIARLRDGYTAEQLREVVLLKSGQWRGDEKMAEYLRPETLFNRTKFATYVGELDRG